MRGFGQQRKAPGRAVVPAPARRGGLRRGDPPVLGLQAVIGNQAVRRLLGPQITPGLRIDAPGDRLERDAEHTAERALRAPGLVAQAGDQTGAVRAKSFFAARFGQDFSQVRIHTDQRSAAMADALNADAFTVGSDIYLGAGKARPGSPAAHRLLAHELAHVMQQSRTGPALQRKLKIAGKPGDIDRVRAMLNSQLFGYSVSVDKTGAVSIAPTKDIGPPSPQQAAAADRLKAVINDPKDVLMTVSAASKTLGGSFATGDFDISDLETYGAPGLVHEIEEQYQKQVKGLAFGTETTGAHGEAIKAESEVRGAKRGPQKVISSSVNADGTMDAVVEIPHTAPDGTVRTMVMTIKRNDIVTVTWK